MLMERQSQSLRTVRLSCWHALSLGPYIRRLGVVAKPSSTVVILAGNLQHVMLEQLDALPNVRAIIDAEAEAASWRQTIARAHTTYVVHRHDPLEQLRAAWVGFFEDTVPVGTLEVAIQAATAHLRGEREALPDYYIVCDPESLSATERHWWFGALAGVAPSRVVPAASSSASVANALSQLPPGRWWPQPADAWLGSLSRFVPDVGMGRASLDNNA